MTPRPQFWALQGAAAAGGVEITLAELEDALEVLNCYGTLDRIAAISMFIDQASLELVPPLTVGPLDGRRVLRFKSVGSVDCDQMLRTIALGESSDRELKSSLYFDHDRAAKEPALAAADYRSEAVCMATLKTIAAFANTGGGDLFVGVRDDGVPIGIGFDFPYLKKPDTDAWALNLRDRIQSAFRDGRSLNDYVAIQFGEVSGLAVGRIRVVRRKDLCYLKDKDGRWQVFRRQGNRSVLVDVWELEEFIRNRDR